MIMLLLLSMLFSMIIFFLGIFVGNKMNFDSEKMSPFECGFSPFLKARLPFSLRFFLISIIFLIFDVELILLFPLLFLLMDSINFFSLTLIMFFIIILIIGLYYENNQGSFNWAI